MDIWAQSYITLHPLLGEVDYGLVKFILVEMCQFSGRHFTNVIRSGSAHSVAYIVANKYLSIDVGQSASVMLSVEVGHQLSFLRFLERDGFETEVCFGWVQASDQVCRPLDFRRCYGTERMDRNLLGWCCHWSIRNLFCRHDGAAFTRFYGRIIMQYLLCVGRKDNLG